MHCERGLVGLQEEPLTCRGAEHGVTLGGIDLPDGEVDAVAIHIRRLQSDDDHTSRQRHVVDTSRTV